MLVTPELMLTEAGRAVIQVALPPRNIVDFIPAVHRTGSADVQGMGGAVIFPRQVVAADTGGSSGGLQFVSRTDCHRSGSSRRTGTEHGCGAEKCCQLIEFHGNSPLYESIMAASQGSLRDARKRMILLYHNIPVPASPFRLFLLHCTKSRGENATFRQKTQKPLVSVPEVCYNKGYNLKSDRLTSHNRRTFYHEKKRHFTAHFQPTLPLRHRQDGKIGI